MQGVGKGMKRRRAFLATALACLLPGCAIEMAGVVNDKTASARIATSEALVDEIGRCPADLNIDPSTFRGREGDGLLGLTECELVAIKGPPTSVQLGPVQPISAKPCCSIATLSRARPSTCSPRTG
jgi:hypothetical protein